MNKDEITAQEMYDYIKNRHYWYFTPPKCAVSRYVFSRKSKLFGLITKDEVKCVSGLDQDEVVKKALINFADTPGKDIEVPFYVDKDGKFYLDVYQLWHDFSFLEYPIHYSVFRVMAEEFKLELPPCIMGEANLWVFNKFGSTFKDMEHFCRFVKAVHDKTGNTVVLAEA